MQTIPLDITACPPKTGPMSMTVTSAPLRAASKAAHRPEIPAPTMTMSLRGELETAASLRSDIEKTASEINDRTVLMPTRLFHAAPRRVESPDCRKMHLFRLVRWHLARAGSVMEALSNQWPGGCFLSPTVGFPSFEP